MTTHAINPSAIAAALRPLTYLWEYEDRLDGRERAGRDAARKLRLVHLGGRFVTFDAGDCSVTAEIPAKHVPDGLPALVVEGRMLNALVGASTARDPWPRESAALIVDDTDAWIRTRYSRARLLLADGWLAPQPEWNMPTDHQLTLNRYVVQRMLRVAPFANPDGLDSPALHAVHLVERGEKLHAEAADLHGVARIVAFDDVPAGLDLVLPGPLVHVLGALTQGVGFTVSLFSASVLRPGRGLSPALIACLALADGSAVTIRAEIPTQRFPDITPMLTPPADPWAVDVATRHLRAAVTDLQAAHFDEHQLAYVQVLLDDNVLCLRTRTAQASLETSPGRASWPDTETAPPVRLDRLARAVDALQGDVVTIAGTRRADPVHLIDRHGLSVVLGTGQPDRRPTPNSPTPIARPGDTR